MRKLILALTALVCSVGVAAAQQAPTYNIGNFPAVQAASQSGTWSFGLSGPIPAGSNTIGSVNVLGGNAVAVKTDGSATTQPVSSTTLSTAANQATEIAALGTPADAAYAGSGSSSIVAALKGLYTALLAPTPAGTNVIGKVGIDQTTPGTTNGVVVNASALATGAATSANQASAITALQTIQQRALIFSDANGNSVAASGNFVGSIRDIGAAPAYSRFNVGFYSTQAGTLSIYNCFDAACSTYYVALSQAVPAAGSASASVSIVTRYSRIVFTNGSSSTASTVYAVSSFTAN